MSVVIQVEANTAFELHHYCRQANDQQVLSAAVQQLLQIVSKYHAKLIPLYPGQSHPLLVIYFLIETDNSQIDSSLIAVLLKLKQIKAAYKQPKPELP